MEYLHLVKQVHLYPLMHDQSKQEARRLQDRLNSLLFYDRILHRLLLTNTMLAFFKHLLTNLFQKPSISFSQSQRTITFIDGDQILGPQFLFEQHPELVFPEKPRLIYQQRNSNMPRLLKRYLNQVELIPIPNLSCKKELVDKYISIELGMAMQNPKALRIIVVSNDYDFIDIFKLAMLASGKSNVHFTLLTFDAHLTQNSRKFKTFKNSSHIKLVLNH
jgi:hypothetical protein